jgi:hypothetical protein
MQRATEADSAAPAGRRPFAGKPHPGGPRPRKPAFRKHDKPHS